jgi:hypothetical protein
MRIFDFFRKIPFHFRHTNVQLNLRDEVILVLKVFLIQNNS